MHGLPLDAEILYENSFALLKEIDQLKDYSQMDLDKIIRGFKKSVELNPLMYTAYLGLGKVYQLNQEGETTLFDDALKWMKRAALLRANRSQVGAEVIELMLSLWPFLNDSDKDYSKQLLEKSIWNIKRDKFISILDIWGKYSKDVSFFRKALIIKKRFSKDVNIAGWNRERSGRQATHRQPRQVDILLDKCMPAP